MGSNRDENFCLRWNDFESNLSTAFMELRNDADMCDVTIATDEDSVAAHKLVLSACSPQLKEMIRKHIRLSGSSGQQNILIYLRGVRHADLVSVLEFMYCGSVNVAQEDLNSFLAVAEDLKVKGLTQNSNGKDQKRAGPASSKRSLTPSGTPGGGGGGGGGTPGPSSAKKFRPAPSSASTSSSSAAQAASTSTPSDHSSSSKLVKQEHKEHDDHEQDTLGGGDQDDAFGDDSHQGGTEDYGGYDDGAADDGLGFDGDESGAGPSDIGKGRANRSPCWNYFTRPDPVHAYCNICWKCFKVDKAGTSSLIAHLRQRHLVDLKPIKAVLHTSLPIPQTSSPNSSPTQASSDSKSVEGKHFLS